MKCVSENVDSNMDNWQWPKLCLGRQIIPWNSPVWSSPLGKKVGGWIGWKSLVLIILSCPVIQLSIQRKASFLTLFKPDVVKWIKTFPLMVSGALKVLAWHGLANWRLSENSQNRWASPVSHYFMWQNDVWGRGYAPSYDNCSMSCLELQWSCCSNW